MKSKSIHCYNIFIRAINEYHIFDDTDRILNNPYEDHLDRIMYEKNWTDNIQWHLEDIIRDPDIDSNYGLSIKRRIDTLNQKRTDTVELIDDYFLNKYISIIPKENARHNTESLGWAIDRLSILSLKEFHLNVELGRRDALNSHINNCIDRKVIVTSQKNDLLKSINWLIEDIALGKKVNKVYKQLKMYNDPLFNPILYNKENHDVN